MMLSHMLTVEKVPQPLLIAIRGWRRRAIPYPRARQRRL